MSDTNISYCLYSNVVMGTGCIIGFAAEIGVPVAGSEDSLQIGKNAHIRSHSVLYSGSVIGDFLVNGHGALIREYAQIGHHVSIGSHSLLEHHVTLGDQVRIHSNCFIPEYTVIGDHAWIGPGVCITNAKYPAARRTKEMLRGVTIGPYAKIGAHTTILPGVHIAEGALVGAGSVVIKDVPPFCIVAGNPAKNLGNTKDLRYDDGTSVYE